MIIPLLYHSDECWRLPPDTPLWAYQAAGIACAVAVIATICAIALHVWESVKDDRRK